MFFSRSCSRCRCGSRSLQAGDQVSELRGQQASVVQQSEQAAENYNSATNAEQNLHEGVVAEVAGTGISRRRGDVVALFNLDGGQGAFSGAVDVGDLLLFLAAFLECGKQLGGCAGEVELQLVFGLRGYLEAVAAFLTELVGNDLLVGVVLGILLKILERRDQLQPHQSQTPQPLIPCSPPPGTPGVKALE